MNMHRVFEAAMRLVNSKHLTTIIGLSQRGIVITMVTWPGKLSCIVRCQSQEYYRWSGGWYSANKCFPLVKLLLLPWKSLGYPCMYKCCVSWIPVFQVTHRIDILVEKYTKSSLLWSRAACGSQHLPQCSIFSVHSCLLEASSTLGRERERVKNNKHFIFQTS